MAPEQFDSKKALPQDKKFLITVGSVGQPRDGNPRACYVIYDSKENSVEFRRIEYDIKKAGDSIRKARLPEEYAERLELGR